MNYNYINDALKFEGSSYSSDEPQKEVDQETEQKVEETNEENKDLNEENTLPQSDEETEIGSHVEDGLNY